MLSDARERALKSLAGLSTGDAFGECFFSLPGIWIEEKRLPDPPWSWTDDTHMALSIVEGVIEDGRIDPDALARRFAIRFVEEPWRGYAAGAHQLLTRLHRGLDWREEAPRLFEGGSYGNGGAMRVAPLGAYFAGDAEQVAEQARLAARVTHAHPEGQAGAMAVAVGASLLAGEDPVFGMEFIQRVADWVPASRIRDGLLSAMVIESSAVVEAIHQLGTGQQVAAFDTVPFCIWVAAHFGRDWEQALWTTASGLGDSDTTCAIVGGLIAIPASVPAEWSQRREPLPPGFEPES